MLILQHLHLLIQKLWSHTPGRAGSSENTLGQPLGYQRFLVSYLGSIITVITGSDSIRVSRLWWNAAPSEQSAWFSWSSLQLLLNFLKPFANTAVQCSMVCKSSDEVGHLPKEKEIICISPLMGFP